MKISRFAGILSLVTYAYLLVPTSSFACGDVIGWASPDASVPTLSMADFVTKAQTELGVDVAQSRVQAMCGTTTDFDVVDHNTKRYMARIPVPLTKNDGNNGRILSARVNQLLKTPREQLISIQDAHHAFRNDAYALKDELGISASGGSWVNRRQMEEKQMAFMRARNLAPHEEAKLSPEDMAEMRKEIDEVPNGQDYFVNVTLEIHCSPTEGRGGPWNVYRDLAIKTIEYIPGRTDYPANTIYQRGDLRKAIFTNPDAMEALKKDITENAQYCPKNGRAKWVKVLERLNGPQSELIKIDPVPTSRDAQPSGKAAFFESNNTD